MKKQVSSLVRGVRMLAGFSLVIAAMSGVAHAGACPPHVPEIDPGSVLGALTLFSGGVMVLTDRRRAK